MRISRRPASTRRNIRTTRATGESPISRAAASWVGISTASSASRKATARRLRGSTHNYEFFGAPAGLFFTLDRDLELGSWLDTGMFIEAVMIAARAYGLHTCPQAAFTPFHRIVRRHLALPDGEILLCGMALGQIDSGAMANGLNTEREPVAGFARFLPEGP